MNKTIHGIVHGKTIELDEELGVADGQEVEVSIKIVQAKGKLGGRDPSFGRRMERIS